MAIFSRRTHPGTWSTVETGSFALPGDANNFSLKLEALNFHFQLEDSSSGSGQKIEILSTESTSVRLKLINFDNPIGTAWESPVGDLNGQELHLVLIIHTITGDDRTRRPRTVTYSFIRRIA